jgi:hypothetical protein
MSKTIIGIGMFVGSTIGSYIPALWGGSLLSFTSILLGVIGGLVCGDLAWVSRIKISRFYLIGAIYHCRPKP